MYCKICGNSLKENAVNCYVCGTPVSAKKSEDESTEIIYNIGSEEKKSRDSSTETQETKIRSFMIETEPKAAVFSNPSDSEFSWNVHDFSKPGKANEPEEFIWDIEAKKFDLPLSQPNEANIESSEIDKFFTFNQKSEEFQKLLDKEYEKIKRSADEKNALNGHQIQSRSETAISQETASESAAIAGAVVAEELLTDQKPDISMAPVEEVITSPEVAINQEEAVIAAQDDITSAEGPIAREDDTPTEEPIATQEDITPTLAGVAMQEDIAAKVATDSDRDVDKSAEMEAARREYFKQRSEFKTQFDGTLGDGQPGDEFDDEDDDQGRSSWGLGKSILAFILLIILIELAMLGVKYFLPDSEAALVIGDFQTNITETVGQWFSTPDGNDVENPTVNEGEGTTTEPAVEPATPAIKPDPLPMSDKTALIKTQIGLNANIKELKANNLLVFNDQTQYKIADIAGSKPISYNIWSIGTDGVPVYYDQAIVGTVIAFDSKWIDYVNDKNAAVLDLTKKDSQAYKNVSQFSKSEKIQEEFLLLEIGEIRQTESAFYVWAHESIQIIENGKKTIKEYRWVYQLEAVENQMKIVNYCKF